MPKAVGLVPVERIASRIVVIRGHRVMLDSDLAKLYAVPTKVLVQAVSRNPERFPRDFMFRLSRREFQNLRSQSVTSRQWGGRRYPPYAFTEHGAVMIATVLKSPVAVHASIQVVRAFIRMREILGTQHKLVLKLLELEKRLGEHDDEIGALFEAIRQLMQRPARPPRRIGFHG